MTRRKLAAAGGAGRPAGTPPAGPADDPFGADFFAGLARLRRRVALGRGGGGGGRPGRGAAPRGVEFRDHRPYAAGDDVHAIDWSVLARLDRPFVKVFRDEERGSLSLLLDATASMGFGAPRKDFLARRIAAACALAALAGGTRVRASRGGDPPARRDFAGRTAAPALLAFLRAPLGGGGAALGRALDGLARARHGPLLLVSDFLDAQPLLASLARLASRGARALLVLVQARGEREPSAAGNVRLVDAETGEVLEGVIDESGAVASAERARGIEEEVRRFAARRGWPFVFARSDRPFEEAALEAIRGLEGLR